MGEREEFSIEGIRLTLKSCRYFKPGRDSLVLAKLSSPERGSKVLEIGCGSGFVSIYLAKFYECSVVGIDLFDEVIQWAIENACLNAVEKRISFYKIDVKDVKNHFPPSSFDIIVSNPPYMPRGSGRPSPLLQKSAARHEIFMNLDDIGECGRYLLKPDGIISLVFPSGRLSDAIITFEKFRFYPSKITFVKPSEGKPSDIFHAFFQRKEKKRISSEVFCLVVK